MPDVSVHLIGIFRLKQACLQYEPTTPPFDAYLLISCGNIIDGVRGINRLPCVPQPQTACTQNLSRTV